MKTILLMLLAMVVVTAAPAAADSKTEQEVRQAILDSNEYLKKNLKPRAEDYSSEGAIEFWSSGGLMQEVDPRGRPITFDSYNLDFKHIRVTTLVPGQAAIAHYYSEGSMKPANSEAVGNYRTRVSQVLVKEGGQWKIRASHWSPMAPGAGTSQTARPE